jgi:hypothetical protein
MENYLKIILFIKKLWKDVKGNIFNTKITNLPEVQKVEVTNPEKAKDKIEVTNFPKQDFSEVINAIKNKVTPLDESATKKQILTELQKITAQEKDEDRTDEVVEAINNIIVALANLEKEDTEIDFSNIVDAISRLDTTTDWKQLKKIIKSEEFQVKINGKQFEKLIKKLGSQIIASSTGNGGMMRTAAGEVSLSNPVPVTIDSEGGTAVAVEGSGAVTVGSSSTAVVSANTNRKRIIMVNDSDEPIYLAYGEAAVMNQGIRLNASGGAMIDDIWLGTIFAICSSGSKELTYIEI